MSSSDQVAQKKPVSTRGRIITAIGLFSYLTVILMQRVNLNVVVPQIVTISNSSSDKAYWRPNDKSLVLLSFYIGFGLTQIIGGVLAEKCGSKICLTISMLISSISCIISPFVFERSIAALILLRVIMGIVQGVYVPCLVIMISNWFQPNYLSSAVGIIFPGTQFGTILALIITSSIAKNSTFWKLSFYLFGGMGFVWLIFWGIFVTDYPQNSKWIKQDEKEFLGNKITKKKTSCLKQFPIKKALTSLPVLAVITAHFAAFWNFALILTIIPSLVEDLFFIEIKDQTYISCLAPLFSWIGGTTSGILADALLRRKILSKLTLRKLLNSITTVPSGLFFMFVTFVSPEKYYWGIVLIVIASYLAGIQFSVIFPNISNICPQHSGIISAISNTVASTAGVSAIVITYAIVSDQHKVNEWQISFGIMLVVQVIGLIVFALFAKASVQSWAVSNEINSTEETGEERVV